MNVKPAAICGLCGVGMVHVNRIDCWGVVREVVFCPACHREIVGTVVDDVVVEVELDFYLVVRMPRSPSMAQLRVLRAAAPELAAKSLREFLCEVAGKDVLKLGPYTRKSLLVDAKLMLEAADLVVHDVIYA